MVEMKKFRMTHHIFEESLEYFTEDTPPQWLTSREFKWFYEGYVLKLEVGKSIDTDFRKIERVR
jgi:hypothetical protein